MSDHIINGGQSKDILAEIINFSADAVISLDIDHNIVFVNASFEKIFGYSSEEILGQSLNILLPKKTHDVHGSYIHSYERSSDSTRQMGERANLFGIAKSGHEVPLDISIQKHPEGSLCRFTAICRDITKRLEQEKRVKEEEEKFRTLFNTSHHISILMDGDCNVLEFNDTAQETLNVDLDKTVGKKLWDCGFWADETDYSLIQNAIEKIQPNKDISLIANARGENNAKVTLEITVKAIWVEYRQSVLIVLEGKDISDVLRSNKALVGSEARLARAQKIARLGNWEWTIATNQIIWSDEVYDIFGVSPDSFEATYEAFLNGIHPDEKDRVEEAVINALKGDKPYRITHRLIRPDGTARIVEERGEVIRMKDGSPVQMVGTIQDVTENWHREQELLQAKKRAEEANIAKVQFLSAVSHELRTPLNAIIGFSSMIAEEQVGEIDNPFYLDYAVDINASGKELLEKIQNILNVTSYELGALKNHPRQFSAQSLIDAIMPLIVQRAGEKNIHVQTFVGDNVPELHLDPEHTQKILIHLIDNAIKFSQDNDKIEIKFSYQDGVLSIDVIDYGIGVEEKDKDLIFGLFVQKEMNINRAYGGVGLGLVIVQNLTELQGGYVTVDSKSGKGSCFSLRFPKMELVERAVIEIGQIA